jgi:hypothetical protein
VNVSSAYVHVSPGLAGQYYLPNLHVTDPDLYSATDQQTSKGQR